MRQENRRGSSPAKQQEQQDTPEARAQRLYSHQGGPLIGWLWDEARRRDIDLQEMAAELGVTYGYINQLRNGIRKVSQISKDFAQACGEFLGIPTVVVLLLAGYITVRDFAEPTQTIEEVVDRAFRQMLDDDKVRSMLPADPLHLPLEARAALVTMYAEVSGRDLIGAQGLPTMIRWLQRAAVEHDENQGALVRGHRDVASRSE